MEWAREECNIIIEGKAFEECRESLDPQDVEWHYDNCVNDAKE